MNGQPVDAPRRSDREGAWARSTNRFVTGQLPADAPTFSIEGRRALSPLQGFGQLWQKTYRVVLDGAETTPAEVIQLWKSHFHEFWPEGNRFFAPLTGISPGEVASLSVSLPGSKVPLLSTGVMVLYADEESFTFMTPQGHMFAGWITFSAFEHHGKTAAQAQLLIRANDPIYEIGFRLGAGTQEDRFWQHTLRLLASRLGVNGEVETQINCVDPRVQWSEAKNIWYNAAIRSVLHMLAAPLRWVRPGR